MREYREKERWVFLYNELRGIVELFINFFERLNDFEKCFKKWEVEWIYEYDDYMEFKEGYNLEKIFFLGNG